MTDNSVQQPEPRQRNGFLEFIYGSVAGVTQVLVGQPFDTIKVRAQASSESSNPIVILQDLLKNEGPLALYKGMSIMVSAQFGGMSFAKKQIMDLKGDLNEKNLTLFQFALGGWFGGICGGFVIAPVEHIRIKMQMQKGHKDTWKYSSTGQCVKQIFQKHGIRGIYKGFILQQWRESSNFVYFGNYEFFKRYFEVEKMQEKQQKLMFLIAGGISGMMYWVASYPIDVIKSRIQADSCDKAEQQYKSMKHCYEDVVKKYGYKGLTRGFIPCFLRSFPTNAASFYAYEFAKNLVEGSKKVH